MTTRSVGLHIRAYNWPLRRAKECAGLTSMALAEATGISYQRYLSFEKLAVWPKDEEAERIAIVLGETPDDLFPENLRPVTGIGPTSVEIAVEPEKVGYLLGGTVDTTIDQMLLAEDIHNALAKLNPRERAVLTARYADGLTLEEAGRAFHVTRERIRQVEAKALRKLRHPSISKGLMAHLEEGPLMASEGTPR